MTLHITNLETDLQEADVQKAAPAVPTDGQSLYSAVFKRALDLTLTVLSLPIVIPLMALLAALVALDGGKPFYSQLRVGRNGRNFRIWKLRSMVANADQLLERHLAENPDARAEWNRTQKLKNDPRITRFGHLLRKTSMDELPQLWNVLNGTMSLVGPRPILIEQKAFYHGHAYYQMRPGITGPWQISDRNNCEFVGRVAYDDDYLRSMSLGTDLVILRKTVGVVVQATGH